MSHTTPRAKNRLAPHIEEAVVSMAIDRPAYGQLRAFNELNKGGFLISPGGVRSVWLGHDMETFQKRRKGPGSQRGSKATNPDRRPTPDLRKARKEGKPKAK